MKQSQSLKWALRAVCVAASLLMLLGARLDARAVDLIGYLPHYRMNNATYNTSTLPLQLAMLDQVRYFGLTINSSGAITPLEGEMSTHLNKINIIKQAISTLPEGSRPRLNITLGGADQATPYAAVAASSTLRATLAQKRRYLP